MLWACPELQLLLCIASYIADITRTDQDDKSVQLAALVRQAGYLQQLYVAAWSAIAIFFGGSQSVYDNCPYSCVYTAFCRKV